MDESKYPMGREGFSQMQEDAAERKADEECECETEYDHYNQTCGDIVYCPMHKAAPGYRAALEEIKRDQGHVCENFELCHHASCQSSYSAWAIADIALGGNTARGQEVERDN